MIHREISRINFRLLALIAVMSILCISCIRDEDDDCGIYLEFIYDMNMEYADSFNPQVNSVDVLVFDNDGVYLFSRSSLRQDLIGGKRMFMGNEMPFGTFKIVTIGGLSDKFYISDAEGNSCVAGRTHMDDIRISLRRESEIVSHEFPPLWMGEPVSINNKADLSVWPVHLIKDTNRFNLTLVKTNSKNNTQKESGVPYTFEIETPEGAVYGYDNTPRVNEKVKYTPYYLTHSEESDDVSVGRINTMRLIYGENKRYNLIIRDKQTQEIVWNYDLMELVTKMQDEQPDRRPDGTRLPLQEYLDRKSEWDIVFLYKEGVIGEDPEYGFIAVAIQINDWILRFDEIDI
ncbi:MAG: FimB/Mfa2 family fimbrial subunit [Bacteroides sp.]|nr:FimB/Mfa2 family fimbrial subunit [Bacteroides sp.]